MWFVNLCQYYSLACDSHSHYTVITLSWSTLLVKVKEFN